MSDILQATDFDLPGKYVGKVRDSYDLGDSLLLIATDRQSAFDRHLSSVKYKGQVLNQISLWWFEQTKNIINNHVITSPDPNSLICKKCNVFKVEFVVRGYLTGSTNTSIWQLYTKGKRSFGGITLSDGLAKNTKLPEAILTPTTKDSKHDEPIDGDGIIATGRMSSSEFDFCKKIALNLFNFGTEVARSRGLILVDSKYEFGKNEAGEILLVDEIHTPDSSRYWLLDGYEQAIISGSEPTNIDKEFLRLWYAQNCDPYRDKVLPTPPAALIDELSKRYIKLYEMMTNRKFIKPDAGEINVRIKQNINKYLGRK